MNKPLRSRVLWGLPEPRFIFKSMGYLDEELQKPLIAVVNSWSECHPGHFHLRELANSVYSGIYMGGGTPVGFNTIAPCDGVAAGHEGMKYILPSRDIIAASIEMMVQAHRFDGMVCICTCDKIVPGMLMAAARLNIPTIFVTGGFMLSGSYKGVKLTNAQLAEIFAKWKRRQISDEEYRTMAGACMLSCGACNMIGTANTMCCLTEALGMSLPGNGAVLAVSARLSQMAKQAGIQMMKLIESDLKPSQIMTREAFENAIRVLMAIGGSTNAILHLPAIASELGIKLVLDIFDSISRDTPWICPLNPNGPYVLQDLEEAGGIPAVMQRLGEKLHLNELTITGKTVRENIGEARVLRLEVIKPLSEPQFREGGIAVLKGNLAPHGAIVRQIGVNPKMLIHEGPARIFDREEDATEAVLQGKISPGDVLVIRYEGPKGGPGMREMHYTASALCADPELESSTALVTDGRFSGGTRGPCIGFVSPEAAEGGPIAIVEDEDIIQIDIPNRKLNFKLSDVEIKGRLARWKPLEPKIKKGFLAIYAQLASSADKGTILRLPREL